jgi:hypothetical protein
MSLPRKLTSKQKAEEQQLSTGEQVQAEPAEFETVEELLRHDAGNTPVPSRVGERLKESIRDLPQPSRAWWKRIFGG